MSKEMFFRTKEAKICLNCNSLEMLDICVSLKDFGKGKDYKLNELFIGQQLSTIKDNYNTKIPPQQFSGVCRIVVKMGNRNKIE